MNQRSPAAASRGGIPARAWLVGTGLRCPLGLDGAQSSFLYRSGASGLRECPILTGSGDTVTMGVFAPLPIHDQGVTRLELLGRAALAEAIAPIAAELGTVRCKLTLLVDEPIGEAPTLSPESLRQFRSVLLSALGTEVPAETVEGGGGAVAQILSAAFEQFDSGHLDCLILGGLHTDYTVPRIRWLEQYGRLYSPDVQDALVPGEAAAFVVLMSSSALGRTQLAASAGLVSAEHAVAKARFDNDESAFEAGALTLVVRNAAAPVLAHGQKLGWAFVDLNFESLRIHEFQALTARSQHIFGPPQHFDFPAHRLGELGAAGPCVHAALGVHAWLGQHGHADGFISIAGSDGGARSALVIWRS